MSVCCLLQVPERCFSYAGTKDKRGVTSQRVTAQGIHAKKLAGIDHKLMGIHMGNYSYVQRPLSLGDLGGNHFQLVLRDTNVDRAVAEQAAASLQTKGFVNYFGMQRFGTSSIATSDIGLAIIKTNWNDAVELILGPRPGEKPAVQRGREEWMRTKDPKAALNKFPKGCTVERKLCVGLLKNKADPVAALNNLPRNMRLMYVHSYQVCTAPYATYKYTWRHTQRVPHYIILPSCSRSKLAT